jgi:hypothetical protein
MRRWLWAIDDLMTRKVVGHVLTLGCLRASMLPQDLRLRQLEQAGAMHIPFTTGILCGIGETRDDRGTWASETSNPIPTFGTASFSSG